MKVKRSVVVPKLRSYFRFESKYFNLKNNLYFNTQLFNNFSFYFIFNSVCLVLGFFKIIFWAIALSNTAVLVFLYLKTKSLCYGLTVTRKAPAFAHEKNEIEVVYSISNETAFPIDNLEFTEDFDGIQAGSFKIVPGRTIPPHTKITVIHKLILNAGMGVKTFKPLAINFRDDMGIYDFKIQFFDEHEIEVYPIIEETPVLKASISPDTIGYGFYEIAKRGDSNLFIGTRDYRHGDPVKHINWKLTKKTNNVVVNEYEKNTNTYITLLLDLDLDNQLGFGGLSTWEAAKDLALSITANEIKKNNLIQVISNNLHIEFGSGKNQLSTIEKHFTLHEMTSSSETQHLKYLQNLPAKSQIYYICPMLTSAKIIETFEFLKKLKMLGQEVVIFALNPYEELKLTIKGDMRLAIMEMERHATEEFKKKNIEFQSMSIPLTILKVKPNLDLRDQLLKEAHDLLEIK